MAVIASSWPTTRFSRSDSIFSSFSFSPSSIRDTGMPVQRDTTAAISCSVTSSFRRVLSPCIDLSFSFAAASFFSSSAILP